MEVKMKPNINETIIAATRNQHKIEELKYITQRFGMDIISRDDAGVDTFEVEETGTTFEENSLIKAEAIMKVTGKITIADDSGIEVDYLSGAPGVYSARYAGEESDDKKNNEKLLRELKDVPPQKRTARFVSVITMIFPDGKTLVARGECEGHIIDAGRGSNGFGYDPLFVPIGYANTYAELTKEQKNEISHRAKALINLEKMLCEKE